MRIRMGVSDVFVEGLKEAAKARGISVATFANDAVCCAVADARFAKWQEGPRPVEGTLCLERARTWALRREPAVHFRA